MFSEVYAPKLLEPIMQVISLTPNGRFCTDRCTHLAYVYLESAVQLKNTYAMLKPHMKSLLFDIVFPRLCISEADAQLFDSDPVEYVRKFNDNMEDFNDPKVLGLILTYSLILAYLFISFLLSSSWKRLYVCHVF
jgi:importin-7